MLISLHKNATTTPATRLALQQSTGTNRELAEQYAIGLGTVRKWRARDSVHDARLCQALGIEHRLTKPRHPQTNGMVERFNGRLSQVLRSHHFNGAEDLEKTLHRYVWLYNQHLPQKALGHETPLQALKTWRMKMPELFVKSVRNHPGPDT